MMHSAVARVGKTLCFDDLNNEAKSQEIPSSVDLDEVAIDDFR